MEEEVEAVEQVEEVEEADSEAVVSASTSGGGEQVCGVSGGGDAMSFGAHGMTGVDVGGTEEGEEEEEEVEAEREGGVGEAQEKATMPVETSEAVTNVAANGGAPGLCRSARRFQEHAEDGAGATDPIAAHAVAAAVGRSVCRRPAGPSMAD